MPETSRAVSRDIPMVCSKITGLEGLVEFDAVDGRLTHLYGLASLKEKGYVILTIGNQIDTRDLKHGQTENGERQALGKSGLALRKDIVPARVTFGLFFEIFLNEHHGIVCNFGPFVDVLDRRQHINHVTSLIEATLLDQGTGGVLGLVSRFHRGFCVNEPGRKKEKTMVIAAKKT